MTTAARTGAKDVLAALGEKKPWQCDMIQGFSHLGTSAVNAYLRRSPNDAGGGEHTILVFSPRQAEFISQVLREKWGAYSQRAERSDARIEVELCTEEEAIIVVDPLGANVEITMPRARADDWTIAAKLARATVQKAKDGGR